MHANRAHARIVQITAGLLAVALLHSEPATAQELTGTYRVQYMGNALTLVLDAGPDGAVRGRLFGAGVDLAALGRWTTGQDGAPQVSGTLSAPGGPGGRFEFSRARGGEFGFLLVPHDADGRAGSGGAQLAYATRLSEAVPRSMLPPGPAAPTGPDGRPAEDSRRLVGVWHTEVDEAGASRSRNVYMELRGDGVLVDLGVRIRSESEERLPRTPGQEAAWRARHGALEISSNGSPWVTLARYELMAPDRMVLVFPQEGIRQVWSRIR